ncbi:AlkA N-terminal domain-containing protein [Aquidulcibacter sp.]|uniref:AlkA N-terminal domain-containing protein n=1 Tax=Aquidulcibacter sp. TaxID=2052990 RepID=UPI0025C399E1|nr:AlkA N-terminal domain-containing protein [Aquidulcibacter sp.]MCA3692170.1 DNA-3-methyladenine glycosylase 2 family protein [Aquidulcibacter sp.]
MNLDQDTCFAIISARDSRYDGRFFTAVKTTGIYCRPVCPARLPKKENVVFFPSAAVAQEAGFRPCLRCRPETAPDTPAWRGTSSSVGRALRLIEEGALDTGSVEQLAARLGLGDRQLRRLFLKHVGASPVSVALTRRLLLAKQLLHETKLSITQIAMASGFGSIRRFNESFQEVFKVAPSFLRREIGVEGPGLSSADLQVRLRYRPPYDWEAMAAFLKARLYPGVETFDRGVYRRSLRVDGRVCLIGVSRGKGDWLDVRLRLQDLTAVPKVIARVREGFDLAADPEIISAHLGQDEALRDLTLRRPGLRVPGAFDPFEIGIRAILGQQITVAAAIKLGAALVQHLGEPLPSVWPSETGVARLFPTAEAILASPLDFLGMPQARVKCLKAYCQAYADSPDFFGGETDALVSRMQAIPGIGPWTANYIALRALRDPDAFPAGDVALARGLALPDGTRLSHDDLEARSQMWRPWRAYAAQHVWTELASG